jgi:hypothetical protein
MSFGGIDILFNEILDAPARRRIYKEVASFYLSILREWCAVPRMINGRHQSYVFADD